MESHSQFTSPLRDITYLPTPGPSFIKALEWQFSGENWYTAGGIKPRPPGERWTFERGGLLSGILFVDIHDAYDSHHGFTADGEMPWNPDGDWCRHVPQSVLSDHTSVA